MTGVPRANNMVERRMRCGNPYSGTEMGGISIMGEWSEFEAGHKAPNDGWYIEVGDNDRIMGINDPRKIYLRKGQEFPEPSNHRRKWKRIKH